MTSAIEDLQEFKDYFLDFNVSDIENVLKLNLPVYNQNNALFTYDEFDSAFQYNYHFYKDEQGTDIEIQFKKKQENKILKLNLFFLPKQQQNKKQGLVTLSRILNFARAVNVNKIELDALSDITVQAHGGYYWAVMGADILVQDIDKPAISKNRDFKKILNKYQVFREKLGLETSTTQKIETLYDLSQDGRAHCVDNYWPGKEFLLKESWSGGWDLDNPLQMRRSYNEINKRLQGLLLDISQNKNDLFSLAEITKLLDKNMIIESSYEKKERLALTIVDEKRRKYKDYETSAVNQSSIMATKKFLKAFSQKTPAKIVKDYPTLAKNYEQMKTLIEATTANVKSESTMHAKITAIKIEREFGKAALEAIAKQQKDFSR